MPTPLVGMLLFIASEVMFFGGLFSAYFNARATFVGEWGPVHPAEPLEIMPIALPITIILLTSSVTMQFGVWAIRRGDQRADALLDRGHPGCWASSSWPASCTTTRCSASGSATGCSAPSSTP